MAAGAGRGRSEGDGVCWPPSSSSSPNFPAFDGGEVTSKGRQPLDALPPLPASPPLRCPPGAGCGPSPPSGVRSGAGNPLPRPWRRCERAPSPRSRPRSWSSGKHRRSRSAPGWKRKFARDRGEGCAQLGHPPVYDRVCPARPPLKGREFKSVVSFTTKLIYIESQV